MAPLNDAAGLVAARDPTQAGRSRRCGFRTRVVRMTRTTDEPTVGVTRRLRTESVERPVAAAPAPVSRAPRPAPARATGDVTTVLKRPQPLSEILRPRDHAIVDRTGALRQRPADLVHRDSGERVLVHVHPDHDHEHRLLQVGGDPRSGQTSIEAAARLLSGHARRSREGCGDTTLESQPTRDVRESSQPPPTRTFKPAPDRHAPSVTLRPGMLLDLNGHIGGTTVSDVCQLELAVARLTSVRDSALSARQSSVHRSRNGRSS
jgi:hypothetical protein